MPRLNGTCILSATCLHHTRNADLTREVSRTSRHALETRSRLKDASPRRRPILRTALRAMEAFFVATRRHFAKLLDICFRRQKNSSQSSSSPPDIIFCEGSCNHIAGRIPGTYLRTFARARRVSIININICLSAFVYLRRYRYICF